jgi:VanZ family protein
MPHWNSRTAIRVGLYAYVAAIAVLAFYPLEATPVTGNDKLNHVLAFFVLAGLADRAYPGASGRPAWWSLLLGYGFLIEMVQHFLPYRHFGWADLGADALGILLLVFARKIADYRKRLQ